MTRSAALELAGVARDFGTTRVLAGLDLTVAAGERIAVIGPSGSGKTTLLRLCAGLLWPSSGRVVCLGQDTSDLAGKRLRDLRRRVGLLHQEGNLVPNLRVAHNVAMGRLGHWSALRAVWSLLVPQELERVRAALAQVELSEKLWNLPETLSGGQQQRVAVARLLVQEPDLLLADEPAASLDPRLGREVVELLVAAARARNAALVVSLHTLELLDAGFERIVALRAGAIFWQGQPRELTATLLRELYGAEYRALHLDELKLGGAPA